MSLRKIIFGKPLAKWEEAKEKLGVLTAVPVLGLDALASTAYGPEAALTALLPLGVAGLLYYRYIVFAVLAVLASLYFSYQQTTAAYPGGGGAYTVAKENLGEQPAVWAAIALLLDYLLNVAVGIAAGVGAVVSAIPSLQRHTLILCLIVLVTLTLLNLRGVRESGLIFVGPVFLFIGCIAVAIAIGALRALHGAGNPAPLVAPPPIPPGVAAVSAWILLGAFANGCTAMTGVEAVSNAVPIFREPAVPNARRTLTVIVGVLALFLLALGYLCPAYRISAMDERQPGYQTILSQLIAAVAGRGVFYYISIGSIFVVLTYSAQTSFVGFPRVCRLLAEDDFLPHAFANLGRRLVFSDGIIVLATLSAILLVLFGGVTNNLIPLFAVGAFSAFLFSQLGMVFHWLRRRGPGFLVRLAVNAVGALTTFVALVIIVAAKFVEGAWITTVVLPALFGLLRRIKAHYRTIAEQVGEPLELQAGKIRPPLVIVPIEEWNRAAEKALRFAFLLSDEITAVHVSTDKDDRNRLKELWKEKVEAPAREANRAVPALEIIQSPYRRLYRPILDFVNDVKTRHPDRLIAVITPELVEPHWYEYLLHGLHATTLRALLYLKGGERTVVINAPWYLRDT